MEISEKAKRAIIMMDETLELAKIGYNAYGDKANWKNHQGNVMPTWEELPANIKKYWCASVDAILRQYQIFHPELYANISDTSTEPDF